MGGSLSRQSDATCRFAPSGVRVRQTPLEPILLRLGQFLPLTAFLLACGPSVYPIEGRHHSVPFGGELTVEQFETERRYVLDVSGVPEPWRLSPTARVYVAWIISPRRGAARLSRVDFDDLGRKTSFDERSPEEGDHVRVTAEEEPWAGEPSPAVLFDRQISDWIPPD